MSLEQREARERAVIITRLQVAVIELRAAAIPTKSEVFTCCGAHASQLADDLEALMGEAAVRNDGSSERSIEDRITDALDRAEQTFSYEADLTQLVDRVATYELRISGEVLTFTDNDDATAAHQYQVHVARARARHRAQAVLAAIQPQKEATHV